MIQFFKNFFGNFFTNFNIFLERNKTIANIFVYLFDFLSRITHFFLFNLVGFSLFMLFLFVIPVAKSQDFIQFFMNLYCDPFNFMSYFKLLSLDLKVLLSFYFFIIESVILCTILSVISVVKKGMVNKYNDKLILKKRGY